MFDLDLAQSRMAFEETLHDLGPSILSASHPYYKRSHSSPKSQTQMHDAHQKNRNDKFFSFLYLELYRPIEIPNFDNSFFRVASVSNRLLMANRDIRQIYDKQWTVTVVNEVLKLFL